jgi:hypothetical protein
MIYTGSTLNPEGGTAMKNAFIAAILLMAGMTGSAFAQSACNRVCLQGFVDQYLKAIVAHDPSRLPLAKNARYTENGQELKMNDGMWRVATAVGDRNIYVADPRSDQVEWRGVIEENGHKQIVMLRLRIQNRKISEMEAIICREGGALHNPKGLVDHSIFAEALPPEDRPSRQELVTIANSYFEGLEQVTGKITPFDPGCTRMENGTVTANNPESKDHGRMSCGDQFNIPGFSAVITNVRERRYPVVDEERGLVSAMVFFDHAGIPEVKLRDGTVRKINMPPFDAPFTFMIGELFKIRNKKITRVEAVLLAVPYGMPSGWVGKK